MNKLKTKSLILLLLIFIITGLLFLSVNNYFYNNSSFLSGIENNFIKETHLEKDKTLIINVKERVSSSTILNLIYFLQESSVHMIAIDVNFNNLSDLTRLEDIRLFAKRTNFLFGYINIENKKEFFLFDKGAKLGDEYAKNFVFLKTSSDFYYAGYPFETEIKNQFGINPERVGLVFNKRDNISYDNIDLLYRFDYKYLLTLDFLTYLSDKKLQIKDIDFLYTKVLLKDSFINYDQKGRSTFLHTVKEDNNLNINEFSNWGNYFKIREEIVNTLKELGLYKSDSTLYENYINEEKSIESIYKISEFKDDNKNSKLSVSKNKASEWRSFKQATSNLIKDNNVIITQNSNYKWVNKFIYNRNVLDTGKNIFRLPVQVVLFVSLLIILSIMFFSLKSGNVFNIIILNISILFIVIPLYFIFRLVLGIDFPINLFSLAIISGLLGGLLLSFTNNYIWSNAVGQIYPKAISKSNKKKVSLLYRKNKLDFDLKQNVAAFGIIDATFISEINITENNINLIDNKISEVKKIIKDNFGVVDSVNQNEILCYFGTPDIGREYWKDSILALNTINNLSLTFNDKKQKFRVALHTKKEWFKFSAADKSYIHYGKSLTIIKAMLKYARKFNIDFIISDTIYKLSKLSLDVRMVDKIKIKNVENPIRLFEFIDKDKKEAFNNLTDYFHAGLKLFETRKFDDASMYFKQCLKIRENDTPSMIYLNRCKEFITNPPGDKWDAIIDIEKI